MKDTKDLYEYIFSSVPEEKKKTTAALFFVATAFTFSPSAFSLGAMLGDDMSFRGALGACILAASILFTLALFWGLLAWKHGLSAAFLVKKYLGNRISILISCVMVSSLVLWIGANGGLISRLCLSAFPSWPLPFPVTVILMLFPVIFFSRWGLDNVVVFGRLFTGLLLALTLYCINVVFRHTNGSILLLQQPPAEELSFASAVFKSIGNFALSTMMMADVCRYAKKKSAVFIAVSGYTFANLLCNLCGILTVQSTGARNFNYGIYLLGLTVPCFLLFLLCIYTTQNFNIYSASLALQKILRGTRLSGNISHSTAAYFIGGAAIISGILGVDRYIGLFTPFLPPLVILCTAATALKLFRKKRGK